MKTELREKDEELQVRLDVVNKKIRELELTKREIVGYQNAVRDCMTKKERYEDD